MQLRDAAAGLLEELLEERKAGETRATRVLEDPKWRLAVHSVALVSLYMGLGQTLRAKF